MTIEPTPGNLNPQLSPQCEITGGDTAASESKNHFAAYAAVGFGPDVLPIIPPDAILSQRSGVDPKQCGKIPGRYLPQLERWVGFTGWTHGRLPPEAIARVMAFWDAWPRCNVGLRSARWPGIDLDIDDPKELVAKLIEAIHAHLGWAPTRGRDGSVRCLLPYRLKEGETPRRKTRITFTFGGKSNAVEILGDGQQYLIEGMHPSGTPYAWDLDLLVTGADMLSEITAAQIDALPEIIRKVLSDFGCDEVNVSGGGAGREASAPVGIGAGGDGYDVRDNTELSAGNLHELERALKCIPCPALDYNTWIKITHAVKAACRGDAAFFADVFLPWSLQYPDSGGEWIKAKWDSVSHSRIGAEWLYGTAREHGFTGGDDPFPDDRPLTIEEEATHQARAARAKLRLITLYDGDADPSINQAERALIAAGKADPTGRDSVYQRGQTIVRPAQQKIRVIGGGEDLRLGLAMVDPWHLIDLLGQSARFQGQKYNKIVPMNFPYDLATMYLKRVGKWNLPPLNGIITAPTLLSGGAILQTPGYDEGTGLLFDPLGIAFPDIPVEPSKDDAVRALQFLCDELLAGFPFANDASKAVAVAGILAACIRPSLDAVPLHAVSAPTAGSGKGLLVNIWATIAEGQRAPALTWSASAEENEKRIDASLLAGRSFITLDNVNVPIGGDKLNSMLTERNLLVRILGASKVVEIPVSAFVAATGNNLSFAADMERRVLECRIVPREERPELRTFDFNPLEHIRQRRPEYLRAALTALRAYHVAGRPPQVSKLGSFDQWSDWVRSTVIWCGFADPCDTMSDVRAQQVDRGALPAVLEAWAALVGERPQTVGQLLGTIDRFGGTLGEDDAKRTALRDALLEVAGDKSAINKIKLGKWLTHHARDKIVGGYSIVRAGETRDHTALWRLVDYTKPSKA
jgi:putative DNA primase/helicase